MNPFERRPKAADEQPRGPDEPSPTQGDAQDAEDTDLGYADDAGHPGGKQDLSKKTESESEHDRWGRHG